MQYLYTMFFIYLLTSSCQFYFSTSNPSLCSAQSSCSSISIYSSRHEPIPCDVGLLCKTWGNEFLMSKVISCTMKFLMFWSSMSTFAPNQSVENFQDFRYIWQSIKFKDLPLKCHMLFSACCYVVILYDSHRVSVSLRNAICWRRCSRCSDVQQRAVWLMNALLTGQMMPRVNLTFLRVICWFNSLSELFIHPCTTPLPH